MGCVTLLSDFGLQDATVASVKGILLPYTSQLPLFDISHLLEPYQLQQAAYVLSSSYKNFPEGTCHLLLFDIYTDKEPLLLLAAHDGHFFLAPDNGILPLAFPSISRDVKSVFRLTADRSFKDWVRKAGEVIQSLQTTLTEDISLPAAVMKTAPVNWQLKTDGNTVECHVIHIDRFENVVVNITRQDFETIGRNRSFRIQFMRDEEITEISPGYSNVREGEKLCRFNAAGYLEIAINHGKAASLFGLKIHKEQHLIYSTIKIFFE